MGKKSAKSEIFAWLADLERAAGDLDGALQRVNGGLTLYPHDVAAMIVRAKILFQKEQYEDCVKQCDDILLKDPFSLAGQKIMGDAYDKLEKIPERNRCYRRYHDMDPLNTFWKDEYDVVDFGESEVAATAAVAATALSEDDFSMGDASLSMPSNVKTLEELEAENAAAMGAGAQEFTSEGLFQDDEQSSVENSFEKAFGDAFGLSDETLAENQKDPAAAVGLEEPQQSESGLFEKSAVGISLDDDFSQIAKPADNPFESGFAGTSLEEAPAEEVSEQPLFSSFGNDSEEIEESSEDDPFAALAAMLPNNDAAEDSMMDELSGALNATMAEIAAGGLSDKPVETFPADENISGGDVNSAMSNFFGMADDVDEVEAATASAPAPVEDKPQSVDNAFDSIFGEDELPEELPQSSPISASSSLAQPAVEDQPQSVDNAFDSIFGEDELPEENLQELKPYTPAASVAEPEEQVAAAPAPAPVEDQPQSVDNAFDSIFGEDELPEEIPAVAPSAATAVLEEPLQESSLDLDSLELPSEDLQELRPYAPSAESSEEVAFEKSASEEIFSETSVAPVENVSLEETPFTSALEESAAPAVSETSELDGAFGSLFGDDELPEEKPSVEKISEEVSPFVQPVESPVDPVISSAMDFVLEEETKAPAVEETAPQVSPENAFQVDNAFDALFGDDDDQLEESPAVAAAPAPVVEESSSLTEQVDLAESELELPISAKPSESDLAKEMGGAFASMFGDQDDLDLPELNAAPLGEAQVAETQQATSAPFEEASEKLDSDLDKSFSDLFGSDDDLSLEQEKPATVEAAPEQAAVLGSAAMPDLDSLESEVSGAFKGLFELDEEETPQEQIPANSGVDFLMSGDSDDEVSAGLINNPDAPLNRGAHDLDESLNTRTLAEIYFDQGLYGKALDIYKDLAQKEPENQEIVARMTEVERLYNEKFGGNG